MMYSVIVPLFNKAEFVVAAVRSILVQEIVDLEVIVVDDGSTDDSIQRLSSISDSRLVVLRQSNAGVSVARNKGIAEAKGIYICFLDADDLWAPDHLTKISALIHKDPSAIAWATGYSEFDHLLNLPPSLDAIRSEGVFSRSLNQRDFMLLWSRCPFFCTNSIAVRAITLSELQPCFPPGERLGEDQDLWFRLSSRGYIRFFDLQTTAFYRRNVGKSLTSADVLAPLPAFVRLKERASGQAPRERHAALHLYNIHLMHVAWTNCLSGRRAVALNFLCKVAPSVSWTYWFRIFVCLLLPISIVHATLAFVRWNRNNTP